jgi:membrane protease subunit (stomatin/prohibitin family)
MPQIMEVLEYLDNTGQTMVNRLPENGECEIKWGAQLTVRESQTAVFFRDGKSLDVFGPGRYVLQTQNVPVIGKWVTGFGYGPKSPFRAEVYFVNMKLFPNLKWGTREPILFKDSELHMIRLRSNGIFSIQITNPLLFVNKIVGTQGGYRNSDIADYLKSIIVSKMTDVLGNEIKTIFDLPKDFNQLALLIKTALQLDFDGLGLSLHDLYINSISLPPEVQSMIDARSGMSAVGNMDEFMKFKAALALEGAANNPGGTAAAGVGVGAGLGMGLVIPQMLQQSISGNQAAGNMPKEGPMDKIKKLKELLDIGAITKDEFDAKKAILMKEI